MEHKLIAAHIDDLRISIRQTSDDSNFSDQFLYKKLLDARAEVYTNQIKKGHKLSEWNYQSFCMPMEVSTYHDCDCIDSIDCKVLKSKFQLPKPLNNRFKSMLEIRNMTGDRRYERATPSQLRRYKHSFTKKNGDYYDIVNNYLIIFDMSGATTFLIKGLFEDPASVGDITVCGSGNEPCYDPLTDDFPLDMNLNNPVYDIAKQKMGITIQFPEDDSNNANSTVTNVRQQNRRKS